MLNEQQILYIKKILDIPIQHLDSEIGLSYVEEHMIYEGYLLECYYGFKNVDHNEKEWGYLFWSPLRHDEYDMKTEVSFQVSPRKAESLLSAAYAALKLDEEIEIVSK